MADVEAVMCARVTNDTGRSHATVVLAYDVDDPLAVTMHIYVVGCHIPWHFARSLLVEGIGDLTGEGDVIICPGDGWRDDIGIVLQTPDGIALVALPRGPVVGFLRRTRALVALGREYVDVDAWVAAINAWAST